MTTETDPDLGSRHIQQTRDGLLGAIKLLTPAQWDFEPESKGWSIAQIVDHVITVDDRVIAMIQGPLATGAPPPAGQDCHVVDSLVIGHIPNRLAKFPSPVPSGRRFDKAEAVQRFTECCAGLAAMLESTPGLRDHVLDSAPLKAVSKGAYSAMDGFQWILAAGSHAERHTKQILELIADESFPV